MATPRIGNNETAEVWTTTDAARFLRVHPKTLCILASEGKIPGARKVGIEWRFYGPVLRAWFEETVKNGD